MGRALYRPFVHTPNPFIRDAISSFQIVVCAPDAPEGQVKTRVQNSDWTPSHRVKRCACHGEGMKSPRSSIDIAYAPRRAASVGLPFKTSSTIYYYQNKQGHIPSGTLKLFQFIAKAATCIPVVPHNLRNGRLSHVLVACERAIYITVRIVLCVSFPASLFFA